MTSPLPPMPGRDVLLANTSRVANDSQSCQAGTIRDQMVRHRLHRQPLRCQGGQGQRGHCGTPRVVHQQQVIVAGQRGVIMRGRKRSRLGPPDANGRCRSARGRTHRLMRGRKSMRRSARWFGCWRGRPRMKSSRISLGLRLLPEEGCEWSRHLRPLLVREPARRIDR